jgi:uncharacterized protein (TIGR00369 family)
MDNMKKANDDFEILAERLREGFDNLPFNRTLGLTVKTIAPARAQMMFAKSPNLIGNYIQDVLHGGVISSVLDATGGLTAGTIIIERVLAQKQTPAPKSLLRMGTIDLRVDYLRPGQGETFIATGSIMRAGRKVAVTRMELHNDQNLLIAVGTGTYLVG